MKVPVSGKVTDAREVELATEAINKGWWTEGEYVFEFERKLSERIGTKFALMVNSGSSANLAAFSALTSPTLGDRQVKKGDEVITVATSFPTTITPIVQHGAVPIFLDITLGEYNIDTSQIMDAITDKTKAIMIAHTLGNPFDIKVVSRIAQEFDLWLIEDGCDALGSTYDGKPTGSFGDFSTLSFFPAHHITTGEGGMVLTSDPHLNKVARSMIAWGRSCYCRGKELGICGTRFTGKYGNLPIGYDHRYVHSELGYNLKSTDLQAAIGLAQLEKLPKFIEKRKENFDYLFKRFKEEHLDDEFILPRAQQNSVPSWFGFPLTLKKGNRERLVQYLDKKEIMTRPIFAGNITKQPCFVDNNVEYKTKDLTNSDIAMNQSFWVGVFPGLEKEQLEFVVQEMKKWTLSQ